MSTTIIIINIFIKSKNYFSLISYKVFPVIQDSLQQFSYFLKLIFHTSTSQMDLNIPVISELFHKRVTNNLPIISLKIK
ncbi:hypothetical protein K5E_06620 [Enterococcus thailandicus]|uniref:Uncharacterized protein n=1 Tax=Enterococcus thailandicus TaxID=417368 RepID=A0A510WI13_ENTTH|nr:hypothetical protein ETH01_06970 [Enterococcus thailandicus]GMC00284.1 hypothetical protein K2F_05430 [Enterococcus thailandicus]GMC04831.1 hypothetical protein K4E_24080 [Enterococcus thailandicus]GMC08523.1 hypothetical protein K5E_06620 [Enterococcus thailandicus]